MRYLVVTKNSDTFNNPSLDAFFKISLENQIKIYLISDNNYFHNFHKNVKVVSFNYFKIYPSNHFLLRFLKGFLNFIKEIEKKIVYIFLFKIIKFDSYFGIDPSGLVELHKLISKFKISSLKSNIVYWSFELTFSDEGALKFEEKNAVKKISHLIIQDQVRLKLILSEFQSLSDKKVHLIPVAPYLNCDVNFKLRDVRIIELLSQHNILYFGGSFTEWSGSEFIKELLSKGLPGNWLIYLNSRYGLSKEEILDLEKYNSCKRQIYISDFYINDFTEYIKFIKNFQCAICIYIPSNKSSFTGKNISYIGLSSGKFTSYLNAKIPIIFNKNEFYEELNKEYNFGISIDLCVNQLIEILNINSFPSYDSKTIPFLDIKKSINNLLADLNFK